MLGSALQAMLTKESNLMVVHLVLTAHRTGCTGDRCRFFRYSPTGKLSDVSWLHVWVGTIQRGYGLGVNVKLDLEILGGRSR
jgi:hypothetical protein